MKKQPQRARAKAKAKPKAKAKQGATARRERTRGRTVLLSGGNPQIAKADGDAPVRAYIAALSGWKRALCKRLDELIVENVSGVEKAVRWNSPIYRVEGKGWIVSFHVFTRYVKVTFFAGLELEPVPPGGTPKSGRARWMDIHEGESFDERRMASWLEQAAKLPGWLV